MNVLNAFAIAVVFGLPNVGYAQAPGPEVPAQTDSSDRKGAGSTSGPSLNAKWVSALVGMKVETPAGARLGTVKDVVVDGYGRQTYAIISHGGMMGLGNKYTAVPWMTVAEMLQRDRLLMDQAQLESAPLLSSAKPDPANRSWRRAADSYWRGKVALGPGSASMPADANARAPIPQSETPPKERR